MVTQTDIAKIINSNIVNPRITWTNITIDKKTPYTMLIFDWTRYKWTETKRGGGFIHWKCKLLKGFDNKLYDYERIYETSFGRDMLEHTLAVVKFERNYDPEAVYDCKLTFHKMSATNMKIIKVEVIKTNEVFIPKIKEEPKQEETENEHHKKIV